VDSAFASGLLTYGPLGAFTVLMLIGWIVPKPMVTTLVDKLQKENDALRMALELERKHGDASVAAAVTTNELIAALKDAAEQNLLTRDRDRRRRERADLTGDDIFP
jgi:hypothetical protein